MKNWIVLFLALCIPLTTAPMVEKKPLSKTVTAALKVGQDAAPHEILGVPANASQQQINGAHRTLALKWHSDTTKESDKEKATEVFNAIQTAYDQLTGKEAMPDEILHFQEPASIKRYVAFATLATIYGACLFYLYRYMYPEDDAHQHAHHQKSVTAAA